ncbi:hypothetical protein CEQ90_01910 [Lewinellaceae bacterium SD302]|nr:hypothetical protein CEQ90_01910 [Lewinellaceae bacterium SD302]
MQFRRLILAALFLGTTFGLSAQDIHYTLHDMSPLWLNPAHTGAFSGSIRVSGHYRADYLGHSGINTPNLSIDAPIIRGLRKQDWIGGGANLIYDQANSTGGDVIRNIFGFSAAYHLGLNKNQTSVLTLGAQYSSGSISLQAKCGVEQYNIAENLPGGFGQNGCENLEMGSSMDDPSDSYTDISAGLMYRTVLDVKKNNTLEMGVAFQHLTGDDYRTFIGDTSLPSGVDSMTTERGGDNSTDARSIGSNIHAHARADFEISENIRLMPTVFFQSSAGISTVSAQAWAGLELKNDMLFKFGLGYRTSDAGKILLGFQKDRLQIAASYDVVLSQQASLLDQSRQGNAVEIAANYIFNIYKKPEPKPSILCPQI